MQPHCGADFACISHGRPLRFWWLLQANGLSGLRMLRNQSSGLQLTLSFDVPPFDNGCSSHTRVCQGPPPKFQQNCPQAMFGSAVPGSGSLPVRYYAWQGPPARNSMHPMRWCQCFHIPNVSRLQSRVSAFHPIVYQTPLSLLLLHAPLQMRASSSVNRIQFLFTGYVRSSSPNVQEVPMHNPLLRIHAYC